MNKYFFISFILGVLIVSGCITQQEIPPAQHVSEDIEKVARFDFMQLNWNSIDNSWRTSKKVTPYVLMVTYNIKKSDADDELKQFVKLQHSYSWLHRFFIWLNVCGVRYYINPPE